MPVNAAYLTVIIIWSTTPIAIQWSSFGVGYEFGVALRMLIGFLLLLALIRLWKISLPFSSHARKVYLTGGLPLFLAMTSVYWSAGYIPSGWISVVFGLTPFFTSLFAALILGEKAFTRGKTLGMLISFSGLCFVFAESFELQSMAWLGVAGVCFSAISHSISSVLLKKINSQLHPVSVTAGSLLFALPLFFINSLLYGLPDTVPANTMAAIFYLAIMGTAIGFPVYFYCLKQMSPQKVALITFITPVCALLIGANLNGETLTLRVWTGTALILAGLFVYQFGTQFKFRAEIAKEI